MYHTLNYTLLAVTDLAACRDEDRAEGPDGLVRVGDDGAVGDDGLGGRDDDIGEAHVVERELDHPPERVRLDCDRSQEV